MKGWRLYLALSMALAAVPAWAQSGGGTAQPAQAQAAEEPHPVRRAEPKTGRNDPCPCGSGKKYKKCHGA